MAASAKLKRSRRCASLTGRSAPAVRGGWVRRLVLRPAELTPSPRHLFPQAALTLAQVLARALRQRGRIPQQAQCLHPGQRARVGSRRGGHGTPRLCAGAPPQQLLIVERPCQARRQAARRQRAQQGTAQGQHLQQQAPHPRLLRRQLQRGTGVGGRRIAVLLSQHCRAVVCSGAGRRAIEGSRPAHTRPLSHLRSTAATHPSQTAAR